MPLLSIIIPVYNVERYLNECVNSILMQDFKDYEIILVDDGSQDNSSILCDEYSKEYNFIITIHKNNGGLSDARNVGLNIAKGEYILFVDSDDFIFAHSLNNIFMTLMEDDACIDVMFLNAVKLFPDGKMIPLNDGYKKEYIKYKSSYEVVKYLSHLPKFPGSACTKLISRKLIEDNNLYFEKGILSEDIDWTIKLLKAARKFNYCTCDYYCYRQTRDGSITNNIGKKNVESLLYIIKKWSTYPTDKICDMESCINRFMAYEYIVVLPNYSSLRKKDRIRLKKEIKEYSWLLYVSKNKKVKITRLLCRILGIEITSFLLKKYLEMR